MIAPIKILKVFSSANFETSDLDFILNNNFENLYDEYLNKFQNSFLLDIYSQSKIDYDTFYEKCVYLSIKNVASYEALIAQPYYMVENLMHYYFSIMEKEKKSKENNTENESFESYMNTAKTSMASVSRGIKIPGLKK